VIYDIRQVTTYDYAAPARFGQHLLRMLPVNREDQVVLSASLAIDPEPESRSETQDFFGNTLTHVATAMAHDRFRVTLTARVDVASPAPLLPDLTPPWEDVAAAALASRDPGPASPAHFVFPSPLVPLADVLSAFAAESFPARRSVLSGALDLTRRLHAGLHYAPGTTDVTTSPETAFAAGRGVCQDFAQIMIAGLRGLGIPAAYVSGYLCTNPPPGSPRLVGADATHAWVMVWCGEVCGWRALDPTNGVEVGDGHITVAVGRDYADVAPIDGVILAAGEHRLTVAVDVVPVDAALG
jgi:transglutaminase-like putative cysteine protease